MNVRQKDASKKQFLIKSIAVSLRIDNFDIYFFYNFPVLILL